MIDMQGIVYFDSECLMCSRSVRLLMRWDGKRLLHFAPLHGETAAKNGLQFPSAEAEDTMVFWMEGRYYFRSDAILKIAQVLGFPWSLANIAQLIPHGWRDAGYRWMARHRYQWFGRAEQCQRFSDHDRNRLLP